jgi:hypothetical protein
MVMRSRFKIRDANMGERSQTFFNHPITQKVYLHAGRIKLNKKKKSVGSW